MNYTPVKCPNCGSGSIVPAERGRIFCKSCDQYFTSARLTSEAGQSEEVAIGKPRSEGMEFLIALGIWLTIIAASALVAVTFG